MDTFSKMTKEQQEKMIKGMYGDPNDQIPYFAALGRLIVNYSSAEREVRLLAHQLSGLKEAIARKIFSGMRSEDIEGCIRQMMKVNNLDEALCHRVNECLTHFKEIGKCRNKLAHRKVSYLDKLLHVTNEFTAKSKESIEIEQFTLTDLENMMRDLTIIGLRIDSVRRPKRFVELSGKLQKNFQAILKVEWLHKPVSRENKKKTASKVA